MTPKNFAAAMSFVMAFAVFLPATAAFAQDSAAAPSTTKATVRKANLKLEHNVRGALYKGKVDGANVRIVAKSGKISLAGTVPDESQVGLAGTIAASVEASRR